MQKRLMHYNNNHATTKFLRVDVLQNNTYAIMAIFLARLWVKVQTVYFIQHLLLFIKCYKLYCTAQRNTANHALLITEDLIQNWFLVDSADCEISRCRLSWLSQWLPEATPQICVSIVIILIIYFGSLYFYHD